MPTMTRNQKKRILTLLLQTAHQSVRFLDQLRDECANVLGTEQLDDEISDSLHDTDCAPHVLAEALLQDAKRWED